MAQYNVALVNMTDGSVQGHKAGCADLKKHANKRHFADEAWELEVSSKNEAWLNYNSDFLAECYTHDDVCDESKSVCANAYDIKWLPCANHVPEFDSPVESSKPSRLAADELSKVRSVGVLRSAVGPKGGPVVELVLGDHNILLRKADAERLARQLNALLEKAGA